MSQINLMPQPLRNRFDRCRVCRSAPTELKLRRIGLGKATGAGLSGPAHPLATSQGVAKFRPARATTADKRGAQCTLAADRPGLTAAWPVGTG